MCFFSPSWSEANTNNKRVVNARDDFMVDDSFFPGMK